MLPSPTSSSMREFVGFLRQLSKLSLLDNGQPVVPPPRSPKSLHVSSFGLYPSSGPGSGHLALPPLLAK